MTRLSESPIEVLESEEIRQPPPGSESKSLKRAKRLLRFFNVDASQWNKRKLIKWMLWKTALFVITIGLGINTVKTTWPIILDYAKSPTWYVSTTLFNESIALPPVVISLILSPYELDDYWKSSKHLSLSKNSNRYQKLLVTYFDNKTITKGTFLANETQWPNYLLFIGYYYLSFFNDFESLAMNFNQTTEDIYFLNDSTNHLATAINILEERMIRLDINFMEFQKKYGAMIKSLFSLTFTKNRQENSTIIEMEVDYCWIYINSLIFFSFEHFEQHPMKDEEAITIQATRSKLPNPRQDYDYLAYMQTDVGGRPYYGLYDVSQASVFSSRIVVVPLQVASTYRTLPYHGGKQQCYENKSIDSCKAECRMDYYRKKCDCYPAFGYTDLLFNGSECYLKHYKTCFSRENIFNTYDSAYNNLTNCEKNCLDICERTKYFIPPQSAYSYQKDDEMFEGANYSIIEMRIAKFDYPIFEETPKWTFISFIGVLGGALGLWMGINVLDCIIYAATGVLFLIQGCKRKATNEANEKSEHLIRSNDAKRRSAWEEDSTPSVWKRYVTATKKFFAFCIKFWTWKKFKNFTEIFLRIMLGMLSLMITLLALKNYFSETTTTVLNVKNNDSITLPNVTICLALYYGELDESSSLNERKVNYTFTLTEYLKMQNLKKEEFVPEEDFWNNTVRNVVHAYLIEISNCEAGDFSNCNRMFANNSDLVSAMNILEIIISNLNISIDELRQKFGKEVDALYNFNVSLSEFGTSFNKLDINVTKYVGDDQICYEVPFSLHPHNITSYFVIDLTEYDLPNPNSYGYVRGPIVFDFENRYSATTSTRKYTFLALFGQVVNLAVELAEYHALHAGNDINSRCSEVAYDECETVHRIKLVQGECNCTPTSWPSLLNYANNNTSNFCNMKNYNSCGNLAESWNKVEYTLDCLRPCESRTLTIREISFIGIATFSQIILSANTNVLMFEEKLTWSFEKLLEIIGGMIGFLLGYSIYDMLFFILIPIARSSALLFKKAIICTHNNSLTADTEAIPAPNTLIDSVEPNAENPDDNRRITKLMKKLKRTGWKGNNLQWLLEYIFKLIALICFGWLTVKMCIPIILKYNESETISIINFVINKSLSLKPATVCIWLSPSELDDHWMKQPNTEFEARIRFYFNRPNITKENFLNGMIWTNTLRYVTYCYLMILTQIETLYDRRQYLDLTLPSITDSFLPHYFEPWGKDLYSAVTLLEKNTNLRNISVNELRQRLGIEVAAIFSLNAYQATYCQGFAFCKNDTKIPIGEVTIIYSNKICYQLRLDLYPFHTPGQKLIVTANSKSLVKKIYNDNQRSLQIYLLERNDSDLDPRIMINKYDLKTSFSYQMQYSIAVNAVYQSLYTLNRCNRYKTRENCMAECRVALFRQMCNCTPTTWSNWVSLENSEECKLSNYISCANYNSIDDIPCIREFCRAHADLCERWTFDIQLVGSGMNTGARLEVIITSLDYPIFKEQYELPFEEFIGALGGAIDFYLGIDFLRIFLIISNAIVFLISLSTISERREHA